MADLFLLKPTPSNENDPPGLCVFDARGSLDAFVRAYYDIALFGVAALPSPTSISSRLITHAQPQG